MDPQFWLERWRTGQIGFHQQIVEPQLERHWPSLGLAPRSRVFVPLCGKSLDMLWLRAQGHEVLGVDISAIALEAFFMEHGIPARRRPREDFDLFEAPGLTLLRGDLFAMRPGDFRGITAVYDRAALICWPPDRRARYVRTMTDFTAAGTQTLLIALEYDQTQMQGPPFAVSAEDVYGLYAPHHSIRECARQDILDSEPRLRAKGLRRLQQVCYHLARL